MRRSDLPTITAQDPRWDAVLGRNSAMDGKFYYSVDTTGVYCRPSCPARRPNLKHVRFHTTGAEAERAGFRPCKRCKPDQPSLVERHAAQIAVICRQIENSECLPTLAEFAKQAELSPHHFHRTFKSITGLTPRGYAAANRAKRLRTELKRGGTVTEAMYDAGYNSSGRFYEESGKVLGMTPSNYRTGGAGTQIHFALGQCALGAILVAMSARGVCAISLGDDPETLIRELQDRFVNAILVGADAEFDQFVANVVGFVEAPALGLDLPLDVRGTAFQQRVWQALRKIPAGSTVSYSEIARRIGSPKSVRAVAGACAANTLAVAIPCHRVVRTDGNLSGYRWGIARKEELLRREIEDNPGCKP